MLSIDIETPSSGVSINIPHINFRSDFLYSPPDEDQNLSALQPLVNDSLVIFPVKTASALGCAGTFVKI